MLEAGSKGSLKRRYGCAVSAVVGMFDIYLFVNVLTLDILHIRRKGNGTMRFRRPCSHIIVASHKKIEY